MRHPADKQLPLPFTGTASYAAADFVAAGSNAQAREWLARPASWPGGRLVLWGAAGAGKTHLLHIWAAANRAEILPGPKLRGISPSPRQNLAVDDADLADEEALLHLLNSAAEAGQAVLLVMRAPPSRASLHLADLASRLRAAQAVAIETAESALLAAILVRLAADRQITISPPVRHFLLTRLERSPAVLRAAVARLDHAALERGVKITRQLAAEILADSAP